MGGREDGEPRLRSPPRSGQTQIAAAVDQVGDPCAQPGLEPCACPEARRRAVAGSLTRAGRDYLAQRPREGRTFSCSDPAWDGGMPPRGSWRRPGGPQPRRPAPLRRDRVDPGPIGAVTTTPVANTEDTSGDDCPTSVSRSKPLCIGYVQESEGRMTNPGSTHRRGPDKHRPRRLSTR